MDIVVGGSGFLGQNLARALLKDNRDVLLCDKTAVESEDLRSVPFKQIDVTQPETLESIGAGPDDTIYHFAANLLVPIPPRRERHAFFFDVNYTGTVNLLKYLKNQGSGRVVYFTTDMVYGRGKDEMRKEDDLREPLGPYGESKLQSELLCEEYRKDGMRITIFRPRLIIGPGRLGILTKLFKLIELNLPVPMIGNGRNFYQFISVYDCVQASLLAAENGVPNAEYNLGSKNPPTVRQLLGGLIKDVKSKSILVPTPAPFVKACLSALDHLGTPLMDPEQYIIANEDCVLSTEKIERELGWQPAHSDVDMLRSAYDEYISLKKS